MSGHYDVAIIGSGFSGSILARILASDGRRVALVDAAKHPRFAIGESSTPIADMLLRRLGERFDLEDLVSLSSFGGWQQSLPGLACGMKRGFSYFDHRNGDSESYVGQRSLVVAASPTDQRSDTHWYRSDVDSYFFRKAIDVGVDAREQFTVTSLQLNDAGQQLIGSSKGEQISAAMIIDASGASTVAARLLGLAPLTGRLNTRTCAAFAHFCDVESFSDVFDSKHSDRRAHVPFDADDAAQHHLIDGGWAWMIRMNNGITSVGVTLQLDANNLPDQTVADRAAGYLNDRFALYPNLHRIMRDSHIVAPDSGLATMKRIQRFYDPVVSPRCLMLPTTALTMDPLHSTGIAHALAGVQRIADMLINGPNDERISGYKASILRETAHLDRMVAMAYHAMTSFPRFTASCMIYFAAAIACEERIASGQYPGSLWQSDDAAFVMAVKQCYDLVHSKSSDDVITNELRNLMKPWNTAGLFECPDNRYAYTATK